jgi:hypothetical protein
MMRRPAAIDSPGGPAYLSAALREAFGLTATHGGA